MKATQIPTHEITYDTYGPPLYGLILQICKNEAEAEKILIQSFREFFSRQSIQENNRSVFLKLLKIAIGVTSEQMKLPKQEVSKLILADFHENALQPAGMY